MHERFPRDDVRKLTSLIREMPGKGRCDLSPLLRDATALAAICDRLARPFEGDRIQVVAGLDAAGLPFAAGAALRLGAGLVLLRRPGKVVWNAVGETCRDYSGEEKRFELAEDVVRPSDRILVVDDWSETGEQLALAKRLLESRGAVLIGCACVQVDSPARAHPDLVGCRLESVLEYSGPPGEAGDT